MALQSLKSTLVNYEAERGTPLSAFEIYKYLHKTSEEKLSFLQVLNELEKLKNENKNIKSKNGFYFLSGEDDKYQNRIERGKNSIKKWKKARKIISIMQIIPFIKSISVSGSLSMNNVFKDSDIDLFITAKKGRIWTTRTLSMLLLQLLLQRRHGEKIHNKVCLNYYVSEDGEAGVKNLASANIFLRTIPVFKSEAYDAFFKNNLHWIKKYFQMPERRFKIKDLRDLKENAFLISIKNLFEHLLSVSFGDKLEAVLSTWQKKRIDKKIKNEKNITNLIYTNDILMFHWPNPRNKEVMERYEKMLNSV